MNKDILNTLLDAQDFVSGQELSEKLGVTRTTICNNIKEIRKAGFQVESVTNKGYRITEKTRHINAVLIERNLKTKTLGRTIYETQETESTNTYLKQAFLNGCPDGSLAVTHMQTAGKGRLGRVWKTERDSSAIMSYILMPRISPKDIAAVTQVVGLAVCRVLNRLFNINCEIKWPNDIICKNKKLCGILCEMSAELDRVNYIIPGIGINCDQESFPEEISQKATSIYLETGKYPDKNLIAAEILNETEKILLTTGFCFDRSLIEEYTSLCATIGRQVQFYRDGTQMSGTAIAITGDGELAVETQDHKSYLINSGEVTVQGIY